MLSSSMHLEEFADKLRGRTYEEVMTLAHEEATEADRRFWRSKAMTREQRQQCKQYAAGLKDFILFLNYGVKTSTLRRADHGQLDAIRQHPATEWLD